MGKLFSFPIFLSTFLLFILMTHSVLPQVEGNIVSTNIPVKVNPLDLPPSPLNITSTIIGSDNINHDGIVNPGENIRYTLEIVNESDTAYTNVTILQWQPLEPQFVINLDMPNGAYVVPIFNPGSTITWSYSPLDPFYQFQLLSTHPGNDSIHIVFQLDGTDPFGNSRLWVDTVAFPIVPLPFEPHDFLMERISGFSFGQLGYQIVDPASLTGHTYQVEFTDTLPDGTPVFDLRDMTSGTVLLTQQPYPDQFNHNSQVVDGFQVTRGTTFRYDQKAWEWISPQPRWLTGVNWGGDLLFGGIDLGIFFFGSTLSADDFHSVKIVFDSTMVTNCAVYRRDLNYQYVGMGTFYGAAFDISDTLNPRRVNIVFTEDDNEQPADMVWNPDTSDYGGRQYFFIMHSDYDSLTAGGYDDNNWGPAADVIWGGWTKIKPFHSFLESAADLYLYYNAGIRVGDVFEFTPVYTGIQPLLLSPPDFQLFQNFPNPFNSETLIHYRIPHSSRVKVVIYNVLGQKVKTLINSHQPAGSYVLKWDGRDDGGKPVASGVYFYRLTTGTEFKTRKLLLIR